MSMEISSNNSSKYHSSSITIGVLLISSYAFYRLRVRTKKTRTGRYTGEEVQVQVSASSIKDAETDTIAVTTHLLTQDDTKFYMGNAPAIGALTWFKGDFRTAKLHLEKRMKIMVEKNPWLQGRISMRVSGGEGSNSNIYKTGMICQCQLSYPDPDPVVQATKAKSMEGEDSDLDSDGRSYAGSRDRENHLINIDENLVSVEPSASPISRDSPIDKLGSILQKSGLMIKNGPHESIFKATIIPCSKNPYDGFALLVQLSHVAGDGATYYKLHRMLCSIDSDTAAETTTGINTSTHVDTENENIVMLDPVRIPDSQEKKVDVMGKQEERYMFSNGYAIRYLIGIAKSMIFQRRVSFKYRWVDPLKIKHIKDEFQLQCTQNDGIDTTSGGETLTMCISTNDIITSWFMSQTACPSGLMLINWRNRLEGHSDLHAGNYLNAIFYRRDDYASPSLIRKSLATYTRAVTSNHEMPGLFHTATTSTSMVTNWSTFAQSNEIQGCEEELHVPISPAAYWPESIPVLTIFRANAKKLGVCYWHTSGENHLDVAPFLTDQL